MTIAEGLTQLNISIMNRLKLDNRITSYWSWNGKVYAAVLKWWK